MRQEQERFRSFDRGGAPDGAPLGVDTNSPRGWNPIDTSGVTPSTESREAFRLREVRLGIYQEDNNGERGEEGSRKGSDQKPDGFEPFLNREFQEEDLFVNNYGGNYAQNMQLNRRGVDRALKIAHLEGKV